MNNKRSSFSESRGVDGLDGERGGFFPFGTGSVKVNANGFAAVRAVRALHAALSFIQVTSAPEFFV